MKTDTITYERIHEVLSYTPFDGLFRWKSTTSTKIKIGDIAGSMSVHGYINIKVDKVSYRAHRLAWLYVYGYMPENDIDHIKRVRHDNRIRRLREVTDQCNARNCGNPTNNISGIKGVSEAKDKWAANIRIDRKLKHLGYYEEFDNAVCARLAAEQCVGWEGCDSSSPAYQYVQNNIQRSVRP